MVRFWLCLPILLACPTINAQENSTDSLDSTPAPTPFHWQGQLEFGYQAHSGNTNAKSLQSRVAGEYIIGRHRTNADWRFYRLDKNKKETKRQSNYEIQTDYKLGPKAYWYGGFQGIDSRYSAYFKDYTWSIGGGYQFIYTDDLRIEMEAGPGYRYQKPNLDQLKSSDIVLPNTVEETIFRTHLKGQWKIIDNLIFANNINLIYGKSNLRLDTEVSLINHITKTISLKINQSQQYHSKVPEGLKKSERMFSVNIRIKF